MRPRQRIRLAVPTHPHTIQHLLIPIAPLQKHFHLIPLCWQFHLARASRLPVGGSRQRCRRIMRKRSWRNGARLLGSKKREGNDDLPNTQSDGVLVCAPEQGGDAPVPEGQAAVGGVQDAKGYQGGSSCWTPHCGCAHRGDDIDPRFTR